MRNLGEIRAANPALLGISSPLARKTTCTHIDSSMPTTQVTASLASLKP